MITTIQLRINNTLKQFYLNEGDNLWEQVQIFTSIYKLQQYQEQIFDLLYQELIQYKNVQPNSDTEQTPIKLNKQKNNKSNDKYHNYSDMRSTKRQEKCQTYVNQPEQFTPKINKKYNVQNHSPFQSRINLKQIVHKSHSSRHEQQQQQQYNFSPNIQTNYNYISTPFKDRLLQKQIVHKDHQIRHQEYQQISQTKINKQKIIPTQESSDDETIQLTYSNNQFLQVNHNSQEQCDKENNLQYIISTPQQLDILVKEIYSQISNYKITQDIFDICLQLYRRSLSSQEYRKYLQFNLINMQILENREIQVLESIVEKYHLSLNLGIAQNQFILLMLNLIIQPDEQLNNDGIKIQQLVNFNPEYTINYQRLLK